MKYTKKKIFYTRFWSLPVRAAVALGGVFFIVIIALTGYVINQKEVTNSHAAASTTLAFSQSTVQVNPGNPISLDIMMNPGNNAVSLVTLIIDYDSTQITPDTTKGIVPNTQVFPQTLDGPTYNTCNGNQCTMSISLSVGNTPTKAVTTQSTIATVNFTTVAQSGTTQLGFDPQTQVFSVAPGDQANENVLSTTTPATITIGQGGPSPTTTPSLAPTDSPTPTTGVTPTVACIGSPCCNNSCPSATPTPTQSNTPTPTSTSDGGNQKNLLALLIQLIELIIKLLTGGLGGHKHK